MKLAIIGSRNLNIDIALNFTPSEIVSGGAKGIDTKAKEYAINNNIKLVEFLPNYAKFFKKAPILRNIEIVDYSDKILAYWDGISKGTKFVIDYATKKGKEIEVVII